MLKGSIRPMAAGRSYALCLLIVLAPAAVAQAKPSPSPRSPNILMVVTDDQRATGTLQAMPATVKAFGRASTRFPNAHVTTPLCCPSRSTIFSGLYAHNHGVFFHDGTFPDENRTVQRWLQRAGYRTGLVGKYLNGWPINRRPAHWNDFWINGGAHRFSQWNNNGKVQPVSGHSTTHARRQATRFIRDSERADRKPWFLYVATTEPHGPLTPQRKHANKSFGGMSYSPAMTETDLSDKPAWLRDQADKVDALGMDPRSIRLAQLRLLQSVDELVADLFAQMRSAGELRDTLVIFTSDNGLMWGEHGGFTIKDLPYEAATHVPLLIRWPRQLAKRRAKVDRRLVANVDLAPTLLDVAAAKRAHKMDGRSLRSRGWRRKHLLLEYGGFRNQALTIPPWAALRSKSDLYVQWQAADSYPAETEYYGLRQDPWELESRPAAAPAALAPELRRAVRCRGPRNCP